MDTGSRVEMLQRRNIQLLLGEEGGGGGIACRPVLQEGSLIAECSEANNHDIWPQNLSHHFCVSINVGRFVHHASQGTCSKLYLGYSFFKVVVLGGSEIYLIMLPRKVY